MPSCVPRYRIVAPNVRQGWRSEQLFTHYDGLIFLTTLDPDDGSIRTSSTEFGGDSEAQDIIFYWAQYLCIA